MKKGFAFILAILYITLTSGVVVNIHYCMGRMAGVTYGHEADHQCEKCGMEQKPGCCQTEHKFVKADSDHISSKSLSAPLLLNTAVPLEFTELITPLYRAKELLAVRYHSPPDVRGNNLGAFISVFRI